MRAGSISRSINPRNGLAWNGHDGFSEWKLGSFIVSFGEIRINNGLFGVYV